MLWRHFGESALRLPPLVLAYVGDAVFELYVRSRLVASGDKVKQLHREAIRLVSANAMAEYYRTIETNLTDTEAEVLHRGRNVKSHRVKSAGVKQYHLSTGFEALVGYLFLSGQEERLEEILGILFGEEQWAR